ncbi:MAG: ParB N-terminal domain-containing protein [Candidatus Paceibacterota bacterium]|jgi:ParB-like chromosome segregation protein Spo0J
MKIQIEIVENGSIKEHELIRKAHLRKLIKEIKKDGFINNPIIVDRNTRIILDGHHRFNAIKFLGLALSPVYLCRL